jgi:hypothetical protein
VINAFNSGANVLMADFEDANSDGRPSRARSCPKRSQRSSLSSSKAWGLRFEQGRYAQAAQLLDRLMLDAELKAF